MSLLTSIMTGGVNNHPTTSDEANAWSTDFISEGIVGSFSGGPPLTGAFATTAQGTPDMTVAVATGVCYVQGTPTSQSSQTFRVKHTASENVTIAANSSGSTKYDWVYIKLDATKLNGPSVAGDDAATLTTSRSTSQSSDDGNPPTYGYPIAVVTVANGATSITSGNIRDSRANCIVNLGSSSVSSGWTELGYAPNTVAANGNRSYTLTFNSTDLTGTTSVGMRLKLPRTVTAPTYMGGAFNGSSHYFTKVTPTGTLSTVTNNWTIMAHVEPTAYQVSTIAARGDVTIANSFKLRFESDGRVGAMVLNGGAANWRIITTYQSLPLNKKTHVTATWTSGTVAIYFDGVSVPVAAAATSGTAPTVAGTGGDFSIGRPGAYVGEYFPGYISSVGVFDAVLTQATVRLHMNQALTGSEPNCIGAWNLNNAATDANAAANNLTATGGVGYTARTPYTNPVTGTSVTAGTTNYGIIMAQTFSTNTTYTIQIPEGETLPTTGGIGTVSYSTQKTPYGFVGQKRKWEIESAYLAVAATSVTAATPINNASAKLNIPLGEFTVGYLGTLYLSDTANTTGQVVTNLSYTAANAIPLSGRLVTDSAHAAVGATITGGMQRIFAEDSVSLTTATDVFVNIYTENTVDAAYWYSATGQTSPRTLTIYAKNDLL